MNLFFGRREIRGKKFGIEVVHFSYIVFCIFFSYLHPTTWNLSTFSLQLKRHHCLEIDPLLRLKFSWLIWIDSKIAREGCVKMMLTFRLAILKKRDQKRSETKYLGSKMTFLQRLLNFLKWKRWIEINNLILGYWSESWMGMVNHQTLFKVQFGEYQ